MCLDSRVNWCHLLCKMNALNSLDLNQRLMTRVEGRNRVQKLPFVVVIVVRFVKCLSDWFHQCSTIQCEFVWRWQEIARHLLWTYKSCNVSVNGVIVTVKTCLIGVLMTCSSVGCQHMPWNPAVVWVLSVLATALHRAARNLAGHRLRYQYVLPDDLFMYTALVTHWDTDMFSLTTCLCTLHWSHTEVPIRSS